MSESKITNEVSQQFLRRTPVKLRQFSRLLNDMVSMDIDPLRVKALLSQVDKTREACVAQGFDSTAKLLNQLLKQLSLNENALETQKPLLKRLSAKLQQHSEKLELGVRPEKESIAKPVVNAVVTTSDAATGLQTAEKTHAAEVAARLSHFEDEIEKEEARTEEDLKVEEEGAEEDNIYLDQGSIIFVSESEERYSTLIAQFDSIGIEVKQASDMEQARQQATEDRSAVIVAPLNYAELNDQLEDNDIETVRTPLIYTGKEDTQVERLQALRSGGTGYLVEPVSMTRMLDYLERQYDIHADSPYRILVMEDSKAQARFYEKILSKGHFEIRVVNDPRVLLEALRSFEPETILMDMQMPTCSGIELTRIIRQMPRYANLPIIFLSAEESTAKQNLALMSGGTAFIVKPVQKDQLKFMADLYSRRYRELNPQIGINPDTGIAYCPQFKQNISVEAARATRNTGNVALALLQLDQTDLLIKNTQFSSINLAVQQLAVILKKRLRKTDIIGHFQTGQVGVILTTGTRQDWLTIMDEIRLQFAELFQQQENQFTISTGVSPLLTNWDAHQWVDVCSQAVAKAVEAGGDQVEVCKAD